MPNIITHNIFCEEVFKKITNEKYKQRIKTYPNEYKIGTNGPDFLFFYGAFPLWKKQDEEIPMIATMFHRENINAFYEGALQSYHQQEEGTLKDAMSVYIIAHYLHWQLDSVMHPYVVYRSGFKEKMSTPYHHRFESMMDTMLLQHYRHTNIKHYKTYEICNRSKYSVDVISNIYLPCVQKCQNKQIDKTIIQDALQDWQKAQRYLYDPYSVKYYGLKIYEKIIQSPWLYSGNIIKVKIDTMYDVCNEKHTLWKHPCTGSESFDSVYDLMDKAIANAQIGLSYLFEALDKNKSEKFLSYIDNKTYNNGINKKLERLYKDVIYD